MKAFTDYPITELGDTEGNLAPVRSVIILDYDGNKYCNVRVCWVTKEIKSGYLYKKPVTLLTAKTADKYGHDELSEAFT